MRAIRATLALWLFFGGCARLELSDPPRVVRIDPADGSAGVDRTPLIRVQYDRRLSPGSVERTDVSLASGVGTVGVSVEVDPVSSALLVYPFRGRTLEPEVEYELRIGSVSDLDGTIAEPVVSYFSTGTERSERPDPIAVPFAEVRDLFAAHCVDGCHGGESPDLGLDLSSARGVLETAVGVPAVQTGGAESYSPRGLRGMEIIDVLGGGGRPATSYLIYKMLGDPHALGAPMPPEGPLELESIERVAEWVRQGARTSD